MAHESDSYVHARADRVHHVTEEDVRVVVSRLPEELYGRLREVHFSDRSWGDGFLAT